MFERAVEHSQENSVKETIWVLPKLHIILKKHYFNPGALKWMRISGTKKTVSSQELT